METILLVDDSKSIRQMVSSTLRMNGYQVLEAEDGERGLEIAVDHSIDLVISDVNMPILNGIEMTKRLRELPSHHETPVLLVTTESQPSIMRQGKHAGACGWIVKPIEPSQLTDVVSQVLAKYGAVNHGN